MAEEQEQQSIKACPVCGVAMIRRVKDGKTIVYRCYSCETEIEMTRPTSLVSNFSMSLPDELMAGASRFYDLARATTNLTTKLRLVRLADDYLRQAEELKNNQFHLLQTASRSFLGKVAGAFAILITRRRHCAVAQTFRRLSLLS